MEDWHKYRKILEWLWEFFPPLFPKMTQEEIEHYETIEEMLKLKIDEISPDDDRPLGGFHDW